VAVLFLISIVLMALSVYVRINYTLHSDHGHIANVVLVA